MNKQNPQVALHTQIRAEVLKLPAYGAGQTLEQATEIASTKPMINLSVNENPLGPSTAALNSIQSKLSHISCYPDSQCKELKRLIAKTLKIDSQSIVIGNGSEDILSMLCKVFLNPADVVMVARPTFALHPIYAQMMGAEVVSVAMNQHLEYDSDEWVKTIQKYPNLKMLMLANPSNPVGCTISNQGLEKIIAACPINTFILIDEAYCEFAKGQQFANSLAILQQQTRPYAILRTFSKAYGLAGLRVGYGIMSEVSVVEHIDRVRTPYNVNRLAQAAAIAVLHDNDYLNQTIELINSERERLRTAIEQLGYFIAPSKANFLFINIQQLAKNVADILLKKGIMVKPWQEQGFENYIRISIGLVDQNDRVIDALTAIAKSKNISA